MDDPKPKWLLVMYITISMTFFTLVGYSIGKLIVGIEFGIVVSLATGISMGFKRLLDQIASLSWSNDK